MHPRIRRRRDGLSATVRRSGRRTEVVELLATLQAVREKFDVVRRALPDPQMDVLLSQLESARRLIELAIDGSPAGDDMMVCANSMLNHLRVDLERLRMECTQRAFGGGH